MRGRARFRWGNNLEFVAEAGPGDFIFVPPFVPHQEINARPDEPVEAVVVRSGQDPIVVNLDIASPENASGSTGRYHFIRSDFVTRKIAATQVAEACYNTFKFLRSAQRNEAVDSA